MDATAISSLDKRQSHAVYLAMLECLVGHLRTTLHEISPIDMIIAEIAIVLLEVIVEHHAL